MAKRQKYERENIYYMIHNTKYMNICLNSLCWKNRDYIGQFFTIFVVIFMLIFWLNCFCVFFCTFSWLSSCSFQKICLLLLFCFRLFLKLKYLCVLILINWLFFRYNYSCIFQSENFIRKATFSYAWFKDK